MEQQQLCIFSMVMIEH